MVLMSAFIGRDAQLQRLDALLSRVTADGGTKPGRAVLVRGRRRVGKSRLVEEFVERAGLPYVFFTASGRSTAEELRLFAQEVAGSNLPGAAVFRDVQVASWDAALQLLAVASPRPAARHRLRPGDDGDTERVRPPVLPTRDRDGGAAVVARGGGRDVEAGGGGRVRRV